MAGAGGPLRTSLPACGRRRERWPLEGFQSAGELREGWVGSELGSAAKPLTSSLLFMFNQTPQLCSFLCHTASEGLTTHILAALLPIPSPSPAHTMATPHACTHMFEACCAL